MTTSAPTDPTLVMAAHSLQASGAPRFLIHLMTLGPGEHRIALDHPEVDEADREGWLFVLEGPRGRRAALSFASAFRAEEASGVVLPTVWHHYLVEDDELREAKTHEENAPSRYDIAVELRALASGEGAVEDWCDACALPLDAALRGAAPPPPVESLPPFAGRL